MITPRRLLALVFLSFCAATTQLSAQQNPSPTPCPIPTGDGHVDRDTEVRPGIAIVPERAAQGATSCTLAFLVTDGQNVYGVTVGHCYQNVTTATGRGIGFVDYGDAIRAELDDVFTAVDCNEQRLCSSGRRIGKFVYVLNNAFKDEVDTAVQGKHNPNIPVGDFALVRLHPQVRYSPKMCHFGGPTGLYVDTQPAVVETRSYGQGFQTGYNQYLNAVVQAWPGIAILGDTPSPWNSRYTFVGTFPVDGGSSGGPIMAVDGRALGVLGGAYYLDRLDTNLQRAGQYLGKTFTVLTAPLEPNAPAIGTDVNCLPCSGSTLVPTATPTPTP